MKLNTYKQFAWFTNCINNNISSEIKVPDAPASILAIVGDTSASIYFTQLYTGGSPIIDYEVISSPDSLSAVGTSSPINITGLTNNTSYYFSVRSRNISGYSPVATSNVIIPKSLNQFTDARDGEVYKTVVIGTQTWMAENFRGDFGTNEIPGDVDIYGRLYDYSAFLNNAPPGWHTPSNAEWNTLIATVGGEGDAGSKLKSTTSWNVGSGLDTFGFNAKAAGIAEPDQLPAYMGSYAALWESSLRAWSLNSGDVIAVYPFTGCKCSVRYIMDAF